MKIRINFFSIFFFLFILYLFFQGQAHAVMSITVTGSWFETIDQNDLTSGAGSDLQNAYTSVSGQISIDISGTSEASDAWRIDIRKVDSIWESNLQPYVMRTSAGTGGSVSGGDSYQEVTDINTSFFSGSGDVTGIKVQLRVTGASIQINPASYSTVLYYTVVDIP